MNRVVEKEMAIVQEWKLFKEQWAEKNETITIKTQLFKKKLGIKVVYTKLHFMRDLNSSVDWHDSQYFRPMLFNKINVWLYSKKKKKEFQLHRKFTKRNFLSNRNHKNIKRYKTSKRANQQLCEN